MIVQAQAREDLTTFARSGLVAPSYDEEHALHEACHATLLDFPVPFGRGLDQRVSERIDMSPSLRDRDWHEIKTCAVELRVAKLIGFEWAEMDAVGVLGGNTQDMDPWTAATKIRALIWTETTYRRALAVIENLRVTARALRGAG